MDGVRGITFSGFLVGFLGSWASGAAGGPTSGSKYSEGKEGQGWVSGPEDAGSQSQNGEEQVDGEHHLKKMGWFILRF